jgi:HD-like signal output (HDOD) protein
LTIKAALAEMEGEQGRYDPRVLEAFRQTMRLEIKDKRKTTKELEEFQDILDEVYQQMKKGRIAVPTVAKAGPLIEQVLKDEEADLKQISRIIELEPSLALKIIATANSSLFYGMAPVNSVVDALVRLGLREARNLLITYMFRSLFKVRQMIFRNAVEAWWEHSLLTATACQSLSPSCGPSGRDYAYLLGLMHDIGKPCLLQALLRELGKKQFTEECLDILFATIARQHSRVGGLVLERANFPESFVKALQFRHQPDLPKKSPDALLLVLAHEIVRQVRSEPGQSQVNLEELLPECHMEITVEDIRRAVSTTIHRYQNRQSLLVAQEEGEE